MQRISSRANEKIKFIRSVRDVRESGKVFIEGLRLAEEALASGLKLDLAAVSPELVVGKGGQELLEQVNATGADVIEVPTALFRQIADTASPQGIILIAERPSNKSSGLADAKAEKKYDIPVIIYLHQINNPSNLGAVIRSAEAAGAIGIITSPGSADPFSAKAIRGSMGSAFRLPIWEKADASDVVAFASDNGFQCVATTPADAQPHTTLDWEMPTILIFGSEGNGLPDELLRLFPDRVLIEMRPPVESLNLAISCGILLFEARRKVLKR